MYILSYETRKLRKD